MLSNVTWWLGGKVLHVVWGVKCHMLARGVKCHMLAKGVESHVFASGVKCHMLAMCVKCHMDYQLGGQGTNSHDIADVVLVSVLCGMIVLPVVIPFIASHQCENV